MKNLTDFRKTVETGVDRRLQIIFPAVRSRFLFGGNKKRLHEVFNERPKSTASGFFAIFSSGSCQFLGESRLYKSRDTKHYKFGNRKGKRLTSG